MKTSSKISRMVSVVGLGLLLFFALASPTEAQEAEVCADAIFTPSLPQSFLPGNPGTMLPFTVDFGISFSSISQVTQHSEFDPDDPFGPDGCYFIDNFGGQFGGPERTSTILTSVDPLTNSQFLDGVFEGTYIDYGFIFTEYPPTPTDYFTLTSLEFCITGIPAVIQASIDIKPGSFPNSINLKSKGNVPVAILSSQTFDAATVDWSTVVFAGAPALSIGGLPEDVNSDGLMDLVLHFSTQSLNLKSGDTEACLTGKTLSEQEFKGCDSVSIVK
ncbi:MAG: hypothetical protein NT096_05305 [Proteobacteria bacterium]|nr:hypothetical protein [Pseudomonadota bacterium]